MKRHNEATNSINQLKNDNNVIIVNEDALLVYRHNTMKIGGKPSIYKLDGNYWLIVCIIDHQTLSFYYSQDIEPETLFDIEPYAITADFDELLYWGE